MSLATILDGLGQNPYSDFYRHMDEYELRSWRLLCEQLINSGGLTLEKVLRLRAINHALENVKADRLPLAA